MSHPLITTKLRVPTARPSLVARPRLREALVRHEGRKLTLVSAPAGFGKTTLLGEWAKENSEETLAWVSLDESDNDPARFLSYLAGALRAVEEGIGEGVPALLHSPEPLPVEVVVGNLVNDLAGMGRGVAIVLDDYHVIGSEYVHEAVSLLIERLPENTRLIIASRADPPLPLSKLRVRGQMAELRAADLRLTTEEATAFLSDVMGLALSAEDVAALEGVTEGWVAALQLAALSMRDREDVSGFVESFSGSNRHVLDFLAEEVLERQPEDVRDFLLRTSVLERMSAPLCDTLTDLSSGQAMLTRLERDNLFVVSLDDERRWYRYHHLFADFLNVRLTIEDPKLVGELHFRASGWHEERGMVVEAVRHALSASDSDPGYDLAARLVENEAKRAWGSGEGATVLGWLEALPEEAKRRRPRLFLELAMALALTGRPADAEPLVEEAEKAAEKDERDRLYIIGFASAIRCFCARLRGDARQAVEYGRRALSLLPDEETPHRNFAAVCLGDSLRVCGDLAAAGEVLAQAAEMGRSIGHVYGTITSMVWQARVQSERGLLREADDTLRRALGYVEEKRAESLPASGLVHIGMGDLLYERNELEEAERELEVGVELAERTREVSGIVRGYVALSRAKRARGNEEGASEFARKAERVARGSGAEMETAVAAAWMARLLLARGELAEAVAMELGRDASVALESSRTVGRLTSARLLHARGRHDDALGLLEKLGEAAESAGRIGSLIEILALTALSLWAKGKKERSVSILSKALALAEPEGYVRAFVDEGAVMGGLLSATLEARRWDDSRTAGRVLTKYIAKLLAALAQKVAAPGLDGRLPESLSEREMEVLALIAAGRSNREIAGRLFVSTSTVKTHINNLYRKLGARSRTQALAKARGLDLI
ncbi:MAG: LuxR C-terminal-related transcriptional regulator [Rubrobacteraceae bacterium]